MGNNILKSAQNYGSDSNLGFRAVFVPFRGEKCDFFASFSTSGFDIQEITLTFTFQNGGTSREWCLKSLTYTFSDTCQPVGCTF